MLIAVDLCDAVVIGLLHDRLCRIEIDHGIPLRHRLLQPAAQRIGQGQLLRLISGSLIHRAKTAQIETGAAEQGADLFLAFSADDLHIPGDTALQIIAERAVEAHRAGEDADREEQQDADDRHGADRRVDPRIKFPQREAVQPAVVKAAPPHGDPQHKAGQRPEQEKRGDDAIDDHPHQRDDLQPGDIDAHPIICIAEHDRADEKDDQAQPQILWPGRLALVL